MSQSKFFAHSALMFLPVQLIALFSAYFLSSQEIIEALPVKQSLYSFFISFAVGTTVLILIIKFLRSDKFFQFLFGTLIFFGTYTIISIYINYIAAVPIALGIALLRMRLKSVFVHNTTMAVALAGISANIGLLLPTTAILIILAALSVYDVIAVYRTRHMVSMMKGLIQHGVPFSLIIPENASLSSHRVDDARPGEGKFIMLGTGDIAFPTILAVSALQYGIFPAVATVIGSLVGLFSVHFILFHKKTGAIPALPPLLVPTILFFLASLFIRGLI